MQRCRFCALESGAVDHSRGEYGLWSVDPRAAEHMMPSPLGMVHAARDGMTMRDAFFQASRELGFSERTTERNLRAIQPVFPGISIMRRFNIPAGFERMTIEVVKELIKAYDADPQGTQKALADEIAKQVRLN